jgi:hypothetical protein
MIFRRGVHASSQCCDEPKSGQHRVVLPVRDPGIDVAPVGFSGYAWSADGRGIYFVGRDPRGRASGCGACPLRVERPGSSCASTTLPTAGTGPTDSRCRAAGSTLTLVINRATSGRRRSQAPDDRA